MVPCHPFNEMKPNSGDAAAEPDRPQQRNFANNRWMHAKPRPIPHYARNTGLPRSPSGRGLVTDETRKPLPDLARIVEMARNAFGAPAHGKGKPAKLRHDGEYALVGDIVADKDRTAALERLVGHQFGHAGCLVEAGMLDLADAFARQHLDQRVRQVGPDQRYRLVDRPLGMR